MNFSRPAAQVVAQCEPPPAGRRCCSRCSRCAGLSLGWPRAAACWAQAAPPVVGAWRPRGQLPAPSSPSLPLPHPPAPCLPHLPDYNFIRLGKSGYRKARGAQLGGAGSGAAGVSCLHCRAGSAVPPGTCAAPRILAAAAAPALLVTHLPTHPPALRSQTFNNLFRIYDHLRAGVEGTGGRGGGVAGGADHAGLLPP